MTLSAAARAAGYALTTFDCVESTNRLALEGAGASVADRTWIVAREQAGGRGRHGRHWSSPPGNLYATLLLIDPCPVALSPRLGFVAGVALAKAVRKVAPTLDARLKWPNDLLCDGAKLTGILLEGRFLSTGAQAVAIGIGVNVARAPAIPGRTTACLRDHGCNAPVMDLFAALSDALAAQLALFQRGAGFDAIRAEWLAHALPAGAAMTVKLHDRAIAGAFAGIDADGRLALDTPGGMVHVEAGDVFLASGDDQGISGNGR